MTSSRLLLSAVALTIAGCTTAPKDDAETSPVGPSVLSAAAVQQAQSGPVDFNAHVRPMLEQHCVGCHDGKQMTPGFMNLTDRDSTLRPGPYGPRIVPGQPDKSVIIKNLSMTHAPVRAMPPVGNRLTKDEQAILRKWIAEGAHWPAGKAGQLQRL